MGWSQKSPTSCDIGLQAERPDCLRLAGCWKRPGSLRIQSRLSRRGDCYNGGSSGLLRGFLRSGFFRSFFGGRLFRSGFLRCSFFCYLFGGWLFNGRFFRRWLLGRYFFSCDFFSRCFFCDYFFRRWLLGRYFFSRRLFGGYFFSGDFFGRCFFRDYFFRWCFFGRYFFSRRFLGCSFFSRRFFRSCHHFLLDHVAKSTSRLEYAKRFAALGLRITGPSAANTGAKTSAYSSVASLANAILEIIIVVTVSDFSSINPRKGHHRTGTRSHGFQKSCALFSGRSFRSSTGMDSPRWGREFQVQFAWRGDWQCSEGSL